MKYIDADKLIAVLERQNADKKVIEPVIRIIASLQQEQPSHPFDLDEAAFTYENDLWESGFKDSGYSSQEVNDAFKAGAEWMVGQGVSMQITDDTEWSEVDSFIHKNVSGDSIIQIRKK